MKTALLLSLLALVPFAVSSQTQNKKAFELPSSHLRNSQMPLRTILLPKDSFLKTVLP